MREIREFVRLVVATGGEARSAGAALVRLMDEALAKPAAASLGGAVAGVLAIVVVTAGWAWMVLSGDYRSRDLVGITVLWVAAFVGIGRITHLRKDHGAVDESQPAETQ